MNNLIVRALTGAVYIAAIVCGVLLPFPAPLLLALLLGTPAAIEYNRLIWTMRHGTQGEDSPQAACYNGWLWADTIIVILTIFLFGGFAPQARAGMEDWNVWVVPCLALVLLYVVVRFLTVVLIPDSRTALMSLARCLGGIAYIGLPLGLLVVFAMWDAKVCLVMFIMIWANDTGAYLVGSRIGRRRLCERLSPKKSWEGFWGGLLLCVLVGLIYALCWRGGMDMPRRFVAYGLMGLFVAIAATLGDLFESMLKRVAGVKDASHLLPGHGGMLDRIDSLLFVVPVTMVLYFFLHGFQVA